MLLSLRRAKRSPTTWNCSKALIPTAPSLYAVCTRHKTSQVTLSPIRPSTFSSVSSHNPCFWRNFPADASLEAGMKTTTAFALGLITSALQMIFVMLSWILTSYLGRRTIYLWGSFFNVVMLVALGIAGSVGKSNSASLAQASLGLIISVLFTLGPAPASWVIIGETSAIRLRPLTTGIGRASYYIVEIPCIFLGSYMLNPTVALFSP